MAPPPPAGALPPPTAGLAKLEVLFLGQTQIADAGCAALAAAFNSGSFPALEILDLSYTQITDAGCAALAAAFDGGALSALAGFPLRRFRLNLFGIPASAAAQATVGTPYRVEYHEYHEGIFMVCV